MRIPTPDELSNLSRGKVIVIYSDEAGIGKSTSCIQSLPEPILDIYIEKRNFASSLESITKVEKLPNEKHEDWIKRVVLDWTSRGNRVVNPTTHEDFFDYLDTCYQELEAGTFPFKSILFDSFGYWINIELSKRLEDEAYQSKVENLKRGETLRNLTEQVQMDLRAYGSLSGIVNRYMGLIKPFSQYNVMVVLIFQGDNSPSYNKTLACAPYIKGKMIGQDLKSEIDYAGIVEKKYINEQLVFPPQISFDKPGYFCKWCGERPERLNGLLLNFKKIFKLE